VQRSAIAVPRQIPKGASTLNPNPRNAPQFLYPPCATAVDAHSKSFFNLKGDMAKPTQSNQSDLSNSSVLSGGDYVFIVFVLAVLTAVLGPPIWKGWMLSAAGPGKPIPMGTVQRIRFVGNLGIDTQIDTDDRSFMVSGISKLQKGMPVHLRRGGWSDALCNADASICERLMGSD
jgi:hypothetical protein